jgi:mRNA-degrading endonuclease YafQ of YafQ-DinJ toxin-antitoxin module
MKPVEFDRHFIKSYQKRIRGNRKLQEQFQSRLDSFAAGQRGAPLHDHSLKGGLAGYRSFSITGDIRVIYYETEDAYVCTDIGTHVQVYGE